MTSEMSFMVESPSKEDQRAVIQFLTAEGCMPAEIHRRMASVYRDRAVSKTTVTEWSRKFREGRTETSDLPRPGQAHKVVTESLTETIDTAVRADRRRSIRDLADDFNVSIGSMHTIVKEKLQYHKVCSQWVPRMLTEDHKERRRTLSLEHLTRFNTENEQFLRRIVAGDETWCHHFEPEGKQSSMQWKHPSSPKPKKFRVQQSAGKVMLTVFFDIQGPLLLEFLEPNETINSQRYIQTLDKLHQAIKSKRPGMLSSGVILLHDNARPHVSKATSDALTRKRWEVLEHPAYSPDLSPCDFHIFGPLKKFLKGQPFRSDEEVKTAVRDWFKGQPKSFFADGIQRLPKQWDKCREINGDFF